MSVNVDVFSFLPCSLRGKRHIYTEENHKKGFVLLYGPSPSMKPVFKKRDPT